MGPAQGYKLDDQTGTGNGTALIKMHQVSKVFKVGGSDFAALKGVSMNFYQGEFVAVVGKSGSGKSTLVNMITGIDRPTTGVVSVGEVTLNRMGESRMSLWRGSNLGIVFQFFQLLPSLTALENVRLPMDFAGVYPTALRNERSLHLLELVQMAEHADQLPRRLSGGQQQSVAIARALANDPQLLVTDEPTGNLDSRSSEQVFSLLHRLAEEQKTVVMVTHDPELASRAGRIITIADGQIVN